MRRPVAFLVVFVLAACDDGPLPESFCGDAGLESAVCGIELMLSSASTPPCALQPSGDGFTALQRVETGAFRATIEVLAAPVTRGDLRAMVAIVGGDGEASAETTVLLLPGESDGVHTRYAAELILTAKGASEVAVRVEVLGESVVEQAVFRRNALEVEVGATVASGDAGVVEAKATVMCAGGGAAPNVPVTFTSSAGTVAPMVDSTDADGVASTTIAEPEGIPAAILVTASADGRSDTCVLTSSDCERME